MSEKEDLLAILRSARDKVSAGWVRGVYCYKLKRTSVPAPGLDFDPANPPKECFCVSGAIGRSAVDVSMLGPKARVAITVAEALMAEAVGRPIIENWNDSACVDRVHAAAMFDKAIKLLEEQ